MKLFKKFVDKYFGNFMRTGDFDKNVHQMFIHTPKQLKIV